jgi:prepilin peptidase CpaA
MNVSPWLPVVIIGTLTLLAAVIDVRTRRIPNWFTVPVLAAGLLFHSLTGGWGGLLMAIGGFVTGFGILLVLWLTGGGGGGDVKLMGAVGAWLGPWHTFIVFLLSGGFAAFFSLLVLLGGLMQHGYRHVQRRHLSRPETVSGKNAAKPASSEVARRKTSRRILPFALPVACSTWVVFLWVLTKTVS